MSLLERISRAVVVAGALVAVVPAGVEAADATSPERRDAIASELSELEETIDEVEAEEQALQGDLEATQQERLRLDRELADLEDELAVARTASERAETSMEAAIAEDLRSQQRATTARRQLREARALFREQAITAFITLGEPVAEMNVFLGVADARNLQRAQVLVDVAVEAQAETVADFDRLRDRSRRYQLEAVAARAEADRRRTQVARQNEQVERLHAQLIASRTAVDEEAAREEQLLTETRSRRASYEQRVTALRAESESISSFLVQTQAGQQPLASGRGALGPPLGSPRVTSRFGYRVHPIFGTRRLHAGIDFGAPTGTPILAAGDGVVVSAGTRGGYGNTVIIDHGGSVATLYAHQSRIGVGQGAKVVRGQVIGYVGSTGNSTGPHLHFEVRVNGTPVDPLNYL